MKNNTATKNRNIYWSVILLCISVALLFGVLVYVLMWSISDKSLTEQYLLWSAIVAVLFGLFLNEFYFHLSYASSLIKQETNSTSYELIGPIVNDDKSDEIVLVKDSTFGTQNDMMYEEYLNEKKCIVEEISETDEYKRVMSLIEDNLNMWEDLSKDFHERLPKRRIMVPMSEENIPKISFALRCNGFKAYRAYEMIIVEIVAPNE